MNVTEIKAREASAPPIPEPEEKATQATGYTCELLRPIEAHGETVTVLKFREPKARDMMNIGNPVIFDPISEPPKIVHDEKRMNAMMSLLAGVPPSSILEMHPRDWVTCAWGLTPFFVPVPGRI